MQLRAHAIRGLKITLFGAVCNGALQLMILFVLARLLTPRDYGVFAGALVIIQPLQATILLTTEPAIVLQREMPDEELSSVLGVAFWALFALRPGIVVAAIFVAPWTPGPF